MIGHLRGTLLEKAPSRLIVDVGGVGYDVQVPLSTFYVVGDPGVTVSLRIHTHVREDVIALYGFATALEHDVFERLIGISGIGPKLALAVLSGIEPADLIAAVRQQDVARLTAIPGIGKKTAERISLELKDRLPTALTPAGQPVSAAAPEDQLKTDLISALLNLGYQRPAAERAIEKVTTGGAPAGFEQALKDVLRLLMRGRT
jgi:Holliday junction DNA helicase RuvA